jgi:hypothetical protein
MQVVLIAKLSCVVSRPPCGDIFIGLRAWLEAGINQARSGEPCFTSRCNTYLMFNPGASCRVGAHVTDAESLGLSKSSNHQLCIHPRWLNENIRMSRFNFSLSHPVLNGTKDMESQSHGPNTPSPYQQQPCITCRSHYLQLLAKSLQSSLSTFPLHRKSACAQLGRRGHDRGILHLQTSCCYCHMVRVIQNTL